MCEVEVKQSKPKTIQERAQDLENAFAQEYQKYTDGKMQRFSSMTVHRLSEAHQTGANCGCYAAGMAIDSLLNSYSKKNANPGEGNEAEKIADNFEKMAKEQYMSSIGEMFSAETLSQSINAFSKSVKDVYGKGIKAEVAEFKTPRKLETIIKLAARKGVRILIPYYAPDDTMMPGVPHRQFKEEKNKDTKPVIDQDGHALPEDMLNAHWAVVSHFEAEDTGSISITLFEGHKMINKSSVNLLNLYNSNLALGDQFDWNEYLKLSDNTEEQEAMEARKAKKSDFFEEVGKRILENVSLRGKVVLVGLEKRIEENQK